MKQGILSPVGARRIGKADLALKTVEYKEYFHLNSSGSNTPYAKSVYYNDERITGTMSVGDDGIIPISDDMNE